MLSHEAVWAAIDALAERKRLTASGLARKSGLDPTSFNKSKRVTSAGRLRWPSTESIAKALKATDTPLDEFMNLVSSQNSPGASKLRGTTYRVSKSRAVPVVGLAQAGVGGFFDDGGFPIGHGWDEIPFPAQEPDAVYALQVTGDSMQPLYRDGDVIIVCPGASLRKGDRVVVKTLDGEVMAKMLGRRTSKLVELKSLNPAHEDRQFAPGEIEWIARIIWASQ
jgi:phage repressor protein C with HTH and peptisase S24 domain